MRPDEAAILFNSMLTSFLETKPNLVKEVKTFYKHKPESMKDLEDAKQLKICLEKKARQKNATVEDKSLACQALRHYDYLLKERQSKEESKEKVKQEKDYKTNFFKFAKEVTTGTYGQAPIAPSFSRDAANEFYKKRYTTEVTINTDELDWFPEAPAPHTPYEMCPYVPNDIKNALSKKCPDSAPGDDQILYGYLSKLPQTHEFLSTLFTKIRDVSQAPDIWAVSKIILIPKCEKTDRSEPSDFRMIALTANVAKLYHSLESSRTINFMITNGYLDPSAQKAYIEGINGCVEHVQVVQEVIHHTKANHRTVHITWFDLIDAFGSLSHMLIPHVFRHYHIPEKIINYIQHIYSRLKGKVCTKQWETDIFEFLKGTFAGDPFSGTVFLVVFNPLIEHIKRFKESQGYKIKEKDEETKETHVITTPFADDFNLISRKKKTHQKLINDILAKAKSMGLSFKPSKCRSLSICNGRPTDVTFVLKNSTPKNEITTHIETVHAKPHKFLGSMITYTNTPQEYFEQLYKVLSDKLENIEASKVRGEHKLAVYERYSLPSMRYHLSIHQLHDAHLVKLDHLSKTYLKRWLNFPKRGVSDIGIFHPYLLKVKQPSQIYLEGHTSNMLLMRMKGDATVNTCIDSRLEREGKWKKKSSTTVKSDKILVKLVAQNKIRMVSTRDTQQKHIKSGKVAVRQEIKEEINTIWNDKVSKLVMQGNFTALLIAEQESITWQSIIRSMPRNVMAFAARLATNSLASPDNLKRWGKRKFSSCPLCSSPSCTLAHITNFCPVALNQGRYTWRHDSVLSHITNIIKSQTTSSTQIFADIPGHQINGITIPADILVSGGPGSKPDLVLSNRGEKKIALMELTCCLQRNTENAQNRKKLAYTDLQLALIDKGYNVILTPFEVGSSGHITKQNKTQIEMTLKMFNIRIRKNLFKHLSQISLLATMSVFYAYQVKEWVSPPFLSP